MIKLDFNRNYYYKLDDMIRWCRVNIGQCTHTMMGEAFTDGKWQVQVIFGTSTFFFKDQVDALLFEMKWR